MPEMPDFLHYDADGLVAPPFVVLPEIKPYSMGWRMGFGEDYVHQFYKWWGAQSQDTRVKTAEAYPETEGWEDFWRKLLAQPIYN